MIRSIKKLENILLLYTLIVSRYTLPKSGFSNDVPILKKYLEQLLIVKKSCSLCFLILIQWYLYLQSQSSTKITYIFYILLELSIVFEFSRVYKAVCVSSEACSYKFYGLTDGQPVPSKTRAF